MDKGFIRILEFILASIFVWIVVMNLTSIGVEEKFFKRNEDKCNNILYLIEKEGLVEKYLGEENYAGVFPNWQNESVLVEYIKNLLKKEERFSLEIKGLPNKNLETGCLNCSKEEIDYLEKYIGTESFPIIEFGIGLKDEENYENWSDAKVIIKYGNLTDRLLYYAKKGGGVVLINSNPDNLTKGILNIKESNASFANGEFYFNKYDFAKEYGRTWIRVYKGKFYLKKEEFFLDVVNNSYVNISNCTPSLLTQGDFCITSNNIKIKIKKIDPLTAEEHPYWVDIEVNENKKDYLNYSFNISGWKVWESENCILGNRSFCLITGKKVGNGKIFLIPPVQNKKEVDLNLLLKTGIIWSSKKDFFIQGNKNVKVQPCKTIIIGKGRIIGLFLYIWSIF